MIVYTDYKWDARVRREAEALAAAGHKVTVYTLREESKCRDYILDDVRVREVPVSRYMGDNGISYLASYFMFLLLSGLACTLELLITGIDAVHIHNMPNFLVFAGVVPKVLGKPVILDMHDCVPEVFSTKFRRFSRWMFHILTLEERISCSFADYVICVNHVQKDIIMRRGVPSKKIFILMNVPDPKMFPMQKTELGGTKTNDIFKIGHHGTITERLGLETALRAISRLTGMNPPIHLYVWGGGDYLPTAIEPTKKLGIENRVHIKGSVKLEVLAEALEGIDLGIVPTKKNTATELMLPMKLLEYIALGIPVVAPKLKAVEYYFNKDMVSYFEPGDIDSMVKAILKLYSNPLARKAQARRAQKFLEDHGWPKQRKRFLVFYETL